MKRKLDQNGVPSPEPETQKRSKSEATEADVTFAEFGLDPRLVQAVAEQSFLKPTLVQRKAIPLALDGKDVLCKSKTGSGKTAAYILPVLAGLLKRKIVRPVAHSLCSIESIRIAVPIFILTNVLRPTATLLLPP